jgi:nitrite reductase (cytochrome c-552)
MKAHILLVIPLVLVLMIVGCSSDGAVVDKPVVEAEHIDPKLDAQMWHADFPSQVESFDANASRDAKHSYLEEYPWLATVYAGSGFAKQYDSARAHPYALVDVNETPRSQDANLSTCWACKTPQYPIAESEDAAKLYETSFNDLRDVFDIGITCYDCHLNAPGLSIEGGTLPYGEGYVGGIRKHFKDAFPGALSNDSACGQCHVEYHFTKEHSVKLPPEITDPFAMFEYYQEIEYVDYTNPLTGTKQLKAQHPEYQTCFGTTHSNKELTCASCHLEKATDNVGQYTSHTITTPSKSETVRTSQCIWCHPKDESLELIKATKERIWPQVVALGERIATFSENFGAAIETKSIDGAAITKLQALHREAQWYWDWVFAENSRGVHNPAQAQECVDRANALLDEAEKLLP